MAFSFDQIISILNNATNEITRAARDFGDERPDDDPLAASLRDLVGHVGEVMGDLAAERDRRAAAGTNTADVIATSDAETAARLREPAPASTPPATGDTVNLATPPAASTPKPAAKPADK